MAGASYPTKDVFIVHSKGDRLHRSLVDRAEAGLAGSELSPWAYDDWRWTHSVPSGRKTYRSSGLRIDPLRAMLRDPRPFVHAAKRPEVDVPTIRRILLNSTVVVLCEPTADRLTPGVEVERTELRKLIADGAKFERGAPVIVRIVWRGFPQEFFRDFPVDVDLVVDRESLDRVLVTVCRAWLVQLFTTGTSGGAALIRTGATVDEGLRQQLPFVNRHRSERVAEPEPEPALDPGDWRAAEDRRIAAGMALLLGDLDEDRIRHGLGEVRELCERLSPDAPAIWRDFAAAVERMSRVR